MKRRPFLKLTGSAIGGAALGLQHAFAFNTSPNNNVVEKRNGIPYRVLGRTGMKVSIVGFSGLSLIHGEQEECNKTLRGSIADGINYLDVAPAYGNGDAEIKMGIALEGVNRDSYYLANKTKKRDKEGARFELERSLKRLKTDHFDVYQMHHLRTTEEVEQAFGPDGAMETIFKAQKDGLIKHIGFSAHTTKSALLAMKKFDFDTVMFPINFIEYYTFGFGQEVIEKAKEQGAAVLAIKPMCGGQWPQGMEKTRDWWYRPLEDQKDISNALNFALTLQTVTVAFPPAFMDLQLKANTVIKDFHAPSDEEILALKKMADERINIFEERQKRYAHATWDPENDYPCPYALG